MLILLHIWLWSACHSQLALVNMDVMENPPPVPVRKQKYWRLHLYTWYHALSSGQWGRVAQRLRCAKSQAYPLPKFNLFNVGQGGSAIDSSLIVEIKHIPAPQHQLNWHMEPSPNLSTCLYSHIHVKSLAMTLGVSEVRPRTSFTDIL